MELTYVDVDEIEDVVLEAISTLHDAMDKIAVTKQAVTDAGNWFHQHA